MNPNTSVPADYAAATQQAAQATQQLNQQLQSPTFQRQARQLMASRMEYEKTVTAMRKLNEQEAVRLKALDTQRRFGRLLSGTVSAFGSMAANPLARQAWGAVQYGASQVQSMARQGFQGTTAQARLENETTLLARELAGAFEPLTDAATRLARKARQAAEKMDRDDQNRLMYATLGVAGAGMAYRYRGAIGGALSGGGSALGLTQGGGLMATAGRFLSRAPLIGSVIGTGMAATGMGTYAADQTNPYTKTFREQNPEMADRLDRMSKEDMRKFWEATKESGKPNLFTRGAANFGQSARNLGARLLNQIPIGDRIKYSDEASSYDQLKRELARRGVLTPGEDRRRLTMQGGGVQEAGAGYFSIMQQYGQAAWMKENGVEEDEATGLLRKIAENTTPKPEVR